MRDDSIVQGCDIVSYVLQSFLTQMIPITHPYREQEPYISKRKTTHAESIALLRDEVQKVVESLMRGRTTSLQTLTVGMMDQVVYATMEPHSSSTRDTVSEEVLRSVLDSLRGMRGCVNEIEKWVGWSNQGAWKKF